MEINELIDSYDFHDSLVQEINYCNNEIVFKIELCNWRQKSYKPNESEMKLMKLVFRNVDNYSFDATNNIIDYDTILEFECFYESATSSRNVKIVLEGEDDIKIIKFRGGNVDVFWD